MNEHLTGDERRLLESFYGKCDCDICKPRREVIAKALRIIDGKAPVPVDQRQREAWVSGSWEDVTNSPTESDTKQRG